MLDGIDPETAEPNWIACKSPPDIPRTGEAVMRKRDASIGQFAARYA